MHVQTYAVDVLTDVDGAAIAYSSPVNGMLSQIRYVKDSFDNGVDFTITLENTGETLWAELDVNASATRAPRQPTHSTAGVASLYAGSGLAVNDLIAVSGRIKFTIAAGGSAKAGRFHITTF